MPNPITIDSKIQQISYKFSNESLQHITMHRIALNIDLKKLSIFFHNPKSQPTTTRSSKCESSFPSNLLVGTMSVIRNRQRRLLCESALLFLGKMLLNFHNLLQVVRYDAERSGSFFASRKKENCC